MTQHLHTASWRTLFQHYLTDTKGATAIEYGILLGSLSLLIIAGVEMTHTGNKDLWDKMNNSVKNAGN